jgi:hypothetical protein
MYTKPLIDRSLATVDVSADLDVIGRLLLAAALNSGFRAKLLRDPNLAVREGFGGERFPITEATLNLMGSIQVSSLPDFISQLDARLSSLLLKNGLVE